MERKRLRQNWEKAKQKRIEEQQKKKEIRHPLVEKQLKLKATSKLPLKVMDEQERKKIGEEMGAIKKQVLPQSEENKRVKPPLPIYLKQKAPLLPTPDCYDSDDPESENNNPVMPAWCSSKFVTKEMVCDCVI